MPHITIRGVNQHVAEQISQPLFEQLSTLCGNAKSSYTLEWFESKQFSGASPFSGIVLIEISWFPRDKLIQDAVEYAVRDTILTAQSSIKDIAVIFHVLARESYYRNGTQF
ncbi:DUF1904 family protein [Shewanella sp. OMA3-2]|uniref:DUF1904 family protein n=1 Tax=Shewanella sp. OMA3-2 TaxID=2908650 RepID=UPI001F157907|nr:DUF1904 family protein [Shewanella sp. OMA3-2]UJF20695.1 DUF1904 domain-containing protein [Shewanella sp. OMA3-2]